MDDEKIARFMTYTFDIGDAAYVDKVLDLAAHAKDMVKISHKTGSSLASSSTDLSANAVTRRLSSCVRSASIWSQNPY
ncbi:hypothetical protein I5N59_24210 [Serratia marcescens]|uniref:hypothetical protein n=1 Tax=Serratia marcescens TaxID=615 RepID=UPI0018D74622|nr:hypothetical protein [Serratia marcescens]